MEGRNILHFGHRNMGIGVGVMWIGVSLLVRYSRCPGDSHLMVLIMWSHICVAGYGVLGARVIGSCRVGVLATLIAPGILDQSVGILGSTS